LHGRPLRGAARVLLTLTGALDSLAIDASVSAANVHWRDWEVTEGLAHVAYQPGPVPVFDAQATADSARLGEYALGGVSARVAGRRDSLTWFARSRVGDLVAFVAGGRYSQHSPLAVGLDSLAVLLPGGVWILQAPAVLTLTDSTAQFSGATLASVEGTGRVAFQPMRTARKQADAHGEVQGFPLAAVYALAQHDTSGVSGAVSGTISITGSREAPVYEGSIALANAALGEFRAPRVDGTFGYRDRRLDAALRLWRDQQAILTVKARLPLDLALQPVAKRQVSDTLAVTARADSVDLSVLEALTPLVRQVQGVFSADVGVAGTWDDPRLHGTVRIGGAAATFPDLNVRYTDMAGRLRLSGDTIGVESLSARSDKGTLSVAGYVRLEELTRPVLALRFAADRFKALDLKGNVTVTASGRLALNGPVFGATLTGQATVTSGVLYFADLIEKRIVNLEELADTTLLSIIERQGLRPQFQSVFLDSLHIRDLQLGMGNEVWLRSNEANIQLQGSVAMSKQRATYLVSGTLQAPRGTYRLKIGPVTREFSVTQGTVRYFGTPDLDAELNIEARHTVHPVQTTSTARGCVPPNEDVVVIAHITGTLLVPKVSLEAEGKDCGQAEVISYVMFGKSSFELTGSQGAGGVYDQRALLQTAASVLSGELERTIVSDLGVPLDYLEIRPGAQQGPLQGLQLAVGRQVGRKTFLIANAGFCQGQAVAVNNTFGLTLKFRISPELRTEASYQPVQDCTTNTGAALQNVNRQFGVDLIWERWY
jgi:translocation and assembly module TamB